MQGPCQAWDHLFEKKGEYQKAIDYFTAVRDFDAKRNVDINLRIYDTHINELKEKLNAK